MHHSNTFIKQGFCGCKVYQQAWQTFYKVKHINHVVISKNKVKTQSNKLRLIFVMYLQTEQVKNRFFFGML